MRAYYVIGAMSGTSLDGLDLALCRFEHSNGRWLYEIKSATTISYSEELSTRLSSVENASALDLAALNVEFGHFIGQKVQNFAKASGIQADLVASHGHTIFHQPENGLTLQIGDGAAIAVKADLPTVCDFRTTDVAHGGQGAPLVPIGDELLFKAYECCLNLGGIANISYGTEGHRIAYDVGIANMALNHLSERLGQPYDEGGEMARTGKVLPGLLNAMNALPFHQQVPPKSLGKEWFLASFRPLLFEEHTTQDLLTTVCEHIAYQVGLATARFKKGRVLVTGGGAFNHYLLERFRAHSPLEFITPSPELIAFKEALIFAFLGLLRYRNEVNTLASVTGAKRNNIGGAIYLP